MAANCSIETYKDKRLNGVFLPSELERYSKLANILVGEVIFKINEKLNLSVLDLNDKSQIEDIYSSVQDLLYYIISEKEDPGSVDDIYLPSLFNAEAIKKITKKTLAKLVKLEDNFDLFKAYHIENAGLFKQLKNTITSEDKDEDLVNDLGKEDDIYGIKPEDVSVRRQMEDKAANEYDSYLSVSGPVKTMFKLLYDTKWNVKTKSYIPKLDSEKLPITLADKSAYNLFIKYFNNIKTEEEFLATLNDPITEQIIPFVVQIKNMLRVGQPNQTVNDRNLLLQLMLLSAKPEVKSDILVTHKNDLGEVSDFISNPISGNRKKILNSWKSNFDTTPSKNKTVYNKRFLTKAEINRDTKDINNAYKILNAIGITISKEVIKNKSNKTQIERQIKKSAEDIKNQLVYIFDTFDKVPEVILNPIADLQDNFYNNEDVNADRGYYKSIKKDFVKGISTTIQGLIDIESEISNVVPSNVGKNAVGENMYNISDETNITVGINALNKSKSLSDLINTSIFSGLRYNPYLKSSLYLKRLYPNGVRDTSTILELSYISGSQNNTDGKKSKLVRKFTAGQKLANDFKSMIGFGRTDVMRLETSSSYPAITIKSKSVLGFVKNKSDLFFEISNFETGIFSSPIVQNQFLAYLNAEIDKVKSYEQKKKENPLISELYGEFLIFDKLSSSLKDRLLAFDREVLPTDAVFQDFIAEYSKILQDKANNFKRRFDKEEITFKDIIPSNLDKEYYPYVGENKILDPNKGNTLVNAFIMNTLAQSIEFSIFFTGDPSLYETMKKDGSVTSDLFKRTKGLASTGVYTSVSGTANRLIDEDLFLNNRSLRVLKGISDKKPISKPSDPTKVRSMIVDEIMYDGAFEPYKNNTGDKASDGEGWASMDFLYELSIRQGWGNEYTTAVFNYESLIYKREFTKIKLTNVDLKTIERHEENVRKNPERYAIPVMKAGYFGNQVNSTIDGKVYDKFSLVPLLPSFVSSQSNKKLAAIMNDMIDNQLDYIKHPSSTKGFKQKVVSLNKIGTSEADILHKDLFKLQLAYSNESSVNTAIPTQLLKLIYSNLFNKGNAIKEVIEEVLIDGKLTKVKKLKPNNEIKDLYNDYISTLNLIQKENIHNLFGKLGIVMSEEGDVKINKEIFINSVYRQAIKRELDSNALNVLRYDPDKDDFSESPELFGYVGELEKILAGIVDKELRRFKVNGGDFVLITNALSDKLKFYTNENGKVTAAEARITLTKEYSKLLNRIHPDGKEIGTLYRLNKLIRENKKWKQANIKLFQIVVDRVPTQEINSMDALEIVEFFSPSIGNAIQLPNEIVTKAGLDFDYDKEKVLLPTFDRYGNFVSFDKSREEIESELAIKRQEAEDFLNDNQYTVKGIYDTYAAAVKEATEKADASIAQKKELKDKIKVLKKRIDASANEMQSLLIEINEQRRAEDLEEIQQSSILFDAIFGMETSLVLDKEYLENEYQEEKSNQEIRLRELNLAYQEDLNLYNKISNYFKPLGIAFKETMEVHESEVTRNMTEIYDRIDELETERANFFSNLSNRVVQNYHKSLLRPERFANLIRPNSADKIKKVSENVSNVTRIKRSLPSRDSIFDYTSQLDVFDIYNTAKNMLGPYAKINTVEKILNIAGTTIRKKIITIATGKDRRGMRKVGKNVYLNHLILSPLEEAVNNGLSSYDISSMYNVSKEEVQEYNSQSINATVDAAKDPFFINLMINYANVGIDILFTSLFKYPYERTKMFLAHPINLFYANKKNKGLSEQANLNQVAKRLGIKKLVKYKDRKIPFEEINNFKDSIIGGLASLTLNKTNPRERFYEGKNGYIEMYEDLGNSDDYNTNMNDIYGTGMFRDALYRLNEGIPLKAENVPLYIDGKHISQYLSTDRMPTNIWEKLAMPINDLALNKSTEFTKDQLIQYDLRTFANFFSSTKINNAFRELSAYLSFDTTKLDGIFGIVTRRMQRDTILRTRIISEEDLVKLERKSIISAFKNEDVAEGAFGDYAPTIISNLGYLYPLYQEYMETYSEKTNVAKRALPTKIMNEFMYSIIYNFGSKAKNGEEQLKTIDKPDIIERLIVAKNTPAYKDIFESHTILTELLGESNVTRAGKFANIRLNKELSLSKMQREVYIEKFSALLAEDKFSPDPKINKAFMKLASDLADVALAQSGLDESYLSYREFIPPSYYADDFNLALSDFEQLNDDQKFYYFQDFYNQFKKNNRSYFPDITFTDFGKRVNYKNPIQNVFKDYTIDVRSEDLKKPQNNLDLIDQFNLALRLPAIKQNFKDGQGGRKMQPKFKGKTTMELTISGDRTRTTRSRTEVLRMIRDYTPANGDIKNLTGMIIKMSDELGNYTFTEITGVFDFTQEYQDRTWQKEGWEKEVTDKHIGDYPIAIEYKVVNKPQTVLTLAPTGEEVPEEVPTPALQYIAENEEIPTGTPTEEATPTPTEDETLTPQEEIDGIKGRIKELEEQEEEQNVTNPYMHILNNLVFITTASAEKETGTKVGIGKDVNFAFINDTKGVSVEKAAELITETDEAEQMGLTVDDVRNEIIELLQIGKTAYRNKYLGSEELRGLKAELSFLQDQMNENNLKVGSHIMTSKGEAIVTSIGKASVETIDIATNKKGKEPKKDLQFLNKQSQVISFLGINYMISEPGQIRNIKTGDIAPLTEESEKIILEKYIEQLTNKKCD